MPERPYTRADQERWLLDDALADCTAAMGYVYRAAVLGLEPEHARELVAKARNSLASADLQLARAQAGRNQAVPQRDA